MGVGRGRKAQETQQDLISKRINPKNPKNRKLDSQPEKKLLICCLSSSFLIQIMLHNTLNISSTSLYSKKSNQIQNTKYNLACSINQRCINKDLKKSNNNSEVKSTCCLCFDSQHPHGSSQPSAKSVLGNLITSSDLPNTRLAHGAHTNVHTKHTYTYTHTHRSF